MKNFILYLLKAFRITHAFFSSIAARSNLLLWGVELGSNVKIGGRPLIFKNVKASIKIEDNVLLQGSVYQNSICSGSRLVFAALKEGAEIVVGKGSGISSSTIVAMKGVYIGKNVNIGGNCHIYDTDFHPLDYIMRRDSCNAGEVREVFIEDDVWLCEGVTVLKGVTIGKGAVVAARSVVTKNVPAMVVVAGNPARIVKEL